MSEFRLPYPASAIATKSRMSLEDLHLLRLTCFAEGVRDSNGAVTLLALQNSCPDKCPEWDEFFIEHLTRFIVDHCYPQGSLDDLNAQWLTAMISSCGLINSQIEIRLLIHVMDRASSVPEELTLLALEQIRLRLARGAKLPLALRPSVTERDMAIVHAVIRASGRRGNSFLSASERAMLLSIEQLSHRDDNARSFQVVMDLLGRALEDEPLSAPQAEPAGIERKAA